MFTIVVRSHAQIDVSMIRGRLLPIRCADCNVRLSVDEQLFRSASEMPDRDARPMRFICKECFSQYFEGKNST